MASKQKAAAAGKRKAGKRKAPADRLDNRYNVNLGPETDAAFAAARGYNRARGRRATP